MPERLRPARDRIVRAAGRQIVFYREFTTARVRDTSTDLARMAGHPAAREASFELHTAWNLIRQLHPDTAFVEAHLCKFDVL